MFRQLQLCAFISLAMLAPISLSSADQLSEANSAYDTGRYEKAMKLFMAMAKQGNALAEFNIAFMYANGLGVPQNYVRAYMWSTYAAADTTDSDFRKQYTNLRDAVAQKMSPDQIAEAQKLEKECARSKFKAC